MYTKLHNIISRNSLGSSFYDSSFCFWTVLFGLSRRSSKNGKLVSLYIYHTLKSIYFMLMCASFITDECNRCSYIDVGLNLQNRYKIYFTLVLHVPSH